MNFQDKIGGISEVEAVAQAAEDLGLETYIVGGYVRDLLLKRTSKDIDFVCIKKRDNSLSILFYIIIFNKDFSARYFWSNNI